MSVNAIVSWLAGVFSDQTAGPYRPAVAPLNEVQRHQQAGHPGGIFEGGAALKSRRIIPDGDCDVFPVLKRGTFLAIKRADREREKEGRHFTDVREAQLLVWLKELPDFRGVDCWLTADQRPDHQDQWINAIALPVW